MVLSAKFVQPRLENDFPISIKNVKTPSLIFINLLRDRYRIFYTLSDLTLVFIKDFKFKKGNRQSQTKMGKIGDLLKNQDQVKKICKAAFDEVDTDKSGNIDQKELGILMTKTQLKPRSTLQPNLMLLKPCKLLTPIRTDKSPLTNSQSLLSKSLKLLPQRNKILNNNNFLMIPLCFSSIFL